MSDNFRWRNMPEDQWREVAENHTQTLDGAKFAIGDFATVNIAGAVHDKQVYNRTIERVIGMRWAGNEIEYALRNVPFLLWESELV